MDFPNYFADAETSFDDASFIVFGVPYEKTSSFRHGADKAPFEVRQASWNFERFDLRTKSNFEEIKVHDYGDLEVSALSSKDMVQFTKKSTESLLLKKKIPVAIGGDHSITPGIVCAFPKDIAVLSLDAHMDFRKTYKNDVNNHACVIRRISEHVPIENLGVIGIRSAEKEEYDQGQKLGLFFRDAFTIRQKGISPVIKEIKNKFKGKKIYLTLDIDVLDPAFAPGTSTPEPFGLHPLEIVDIIDAVAPQLIGCDVVEVCPAFDHGQTAVLAARLLRIAISGIWNNRKA